MNDQPSPDPEVLAEDGRSAWQRIWWSIDCNVRALWAWLGLPC